MFVAVRLTSDGSVPVLLESSACAVPGLVASLLRGALSVSAVGLSTGVLHSVEVEYVPVFLLAPSGKALVAVGAKDSTADSCQAAVELVHLTAALVHDAGAF